MKQAEYQQFVPGSGDTLRDRITSPEIVAINAVVDGRATPEQAKMAFEWVMREACQYGRTAMVLGGMDGQRATDHLLGRQYVAQLIHRVISPDFFVRRRGGNPVAEDRALHT